MKYSLHISLKTLLILFSLSLSNLLSAQGSYIKSGDRIQFGLNIIDNGDENFSHCNVKYKNGIKTFGPDEISEYFISPNQYYESKTIHIAYFDERVFLKRLNDFKPEVYSFYKDGDYLFFIQIDTQLVSLSGTRAEFVDKLQDYFPDHPLPEKEINKLRKNENELIQFLDIYKSGKPHIINSPAYGSIVSIGKLVYPMDVYPMDAFNSGFDGPDNFNSIGLSVITEQPISLSSFYTGVSLNLRHMYMETDSTNWAHSSIGSRIHVDYTVPVRFVKPFIGIGYNFQFNTISKYYLEDNKPFTIYTGKFLIMGLKIDLYKNTKLYIATRITKGGIISKDEWNLKSLDVGLLF